MRFRFAVTVLALVVGGGVLGAGQPSPDFVAEKMTVARMHNLGLKLEEWRLEKNGEAPNSLDVLRKRFGLSKELTQDGWGRELYFYLSSQHCVIASFGKDGLPDAQSSPAGGTLTTPKHDADIVWIDGEWAQTPYGIGR